MSKIEVLKDKVKALYLTKDPNRADWADWLFENHVFVVADNAEKLADRFGAKKDLAVAAAVLHDVADAVMRREDDRHEQKSLEMATQYLTESGFSADEINTIVQDAIRFHGCHENSPQTLEGKVMATADALAHLQTNFYDYALGILAKEKSTQEIRMWALPKIERDFQKKIFFQDVKDGARADYERVKGLFNENLLKP